MKDVAFMPNAISSSTDLALELELYRLHFRFLETADQYFEYPSHASRQGKVEYL
jgi:hypothetical protein